MNKFRKLRVCSISVWPRLLPFAERAVRFGLTSHPTVRRHVCFPSCYFPSFVDEKASYYATLASHHQPTSSFILTSEQLENVATSITTTSELHLLFLTILLGSFRPSSTSKLQERQIEEINKVASLFLSKWCSLPESVCIVINPSIYIIYIISCLYVEELNDILDIDSFTLLVGIPLIPSDSCSHSCLFEGICS